MRQRRKKVFSLPSCACRGCEIEAGEQCECFCNVFFEGVNFLKEIQLAFQAIVGEISFSNVFMGNILIHQHSFLYFRETPCSVIELLLLCW